MKVLEVAYGVLDKLKEHGFDSYIVGGAVRDHLLKRPFSDIDITTNAKPFQVMKIFKSEPTGIKYGTVTIFEDEYQFEVTTFRSDGKSSNNRHPDVVYYGDSVIEDVQRRDFTINGLLLNRHGEVHDYVQGQLDLKNKIIRTINNPIDRFNEDALRILRAFYFQAKLDFIIDKYTKEGIRGARELIKKLPSERIITELIKMLREEHSLTALRSMVELGVHEMLPGMTEGILFIANQSKKPYNDTFFTLCTKLNGGRIHPFWKFSNQNKYKYIQAAKLAIKFDNVVSDYDLFEMGLKTSLLANSVNEFIGSESISREELNYRFTNLPIKSELELKITPTEMIEFVGKKAGAWINLYRKELAKLVIERKLENNKEVLKSYIVQLEKGVNND